MVFIVLFLCKLDIFQNKKEGTKDVLRQRTLQSTDPWIFIALKIYLTLNNNSLYYLRVVDFKINKLYNFNGLLIIIT